MMPKTLHTMGNFKNAWYDYARDNRAGLVSDPLGKPDRDTEHTCHWAAFCAASVEFLCDRYGVVCPAWVFEPAYTLATPWYGDTINRRKSRRELRQRDKYGHLQAAQSSKAGRKKRK